MRFCAAPPIPLEDPLAGRLQPAARAGVAAFLALAEVFGDLAQEPRLRAAMEQAAERISRLGVRGALMAYLEARPQQV